jgi:hypothetical protein
MARLRDITFALLCATGLIVGCSTPPANAETKTPEMRITAWLQEGSSLQMSSFLEPVKPGAPPHDVEAYPVPCLSYDRAKDGKPEGITCFWGGEWLHLNGVPSSEAGLYVHLEGNELRLDMSAKGFEHSNLMISWTKRGALEYGDGLNQSPPLFRHAVVAPHFGAVTLLFHKEPDGKSCYWKRES